MVNYADDIKSSFNMIALQYVNTQFINPLKSILQKCIQCDCTLNHMRFKTCK